MIDTLRPVDASGTLVTSFLTQLAFNTLVGNADAHAKNYSILLGRNGITFAPIYDVVPMGLYPAYDQKFAMRIAGARMAAEVTISHWRKLARTSGLDEDAVAHQVIDLARNILEHNNNAWNALNPDQSETVRTAVARHAERLLRGP